jgi:hypothetical protein
VHDNLPSLDTITIAENGREIVIQPDQLLLAVRIARAFRAYDALASSA